MLINESLKTFFFFDFIIIVIVSSRSMYKWKSAMSSFVFFNRPVLSLVKQKTPIILPGFESVSVSDELSAQYSVSLAIKRRSLPVALCTYGSSRYV